MMNRHSGIPFLRRMNIQMRLLLAILCCSLIPVTLFGLYASNIYASTIHDKVGEYTEQSTALLSKNLETALKPYAAYMNSLSVSSDMGQLFHAYEYGEEYSRYLGPLLRNGLSAFNVGQYLRDLQIYSADGVLIGSTGYEKTGDSLMENLIEKINMQSSDKYLGCTASGALILGCKIYQYAPSLRLQGYLVLCVSPQLLSKEIFSYVSFGDGAIVFFSSADGTAIFQDASDSESTLTQAFTDKESDIWDLDLDGKRYLLVSNESEEYGCSFAVALPYTIIQARMGSTICTLILLAAGLFVLSFIVMLIVYHSIMQPIRRILSHCNDDLAVLDQPINDQSPDEIGILARTLDTLVARLYDMAETQKKNEQRKRELELSALQYQISPHFLFNTLNTFKWIAELNDVPSLSQGIGSLSSLLKSTLLDTNDMHPLSCELKDLESYFEIQRLRYADQFVVAYQIDETLLQIVVPRFILQPLAENAIVHGLDPSGCILTITIRVLRYGEENLQLVVADDGTGFDTKGCKGHKSSSGVGLSNVSERLKIHYGGNFGLTVISTPDQGTTCVITIPLRKEAR